MHIHIKATKQEVLDSLGASNRPEDIEDKAWLQDNMKSYMISVIDDSADIADLTVEIEDMKDADI